MFLRPGNMFVYEEIVFWLRIECVRMSILLFLSPSSQFFNYPRVFSQLSVLKGFCVITFPRSHGCRTRRYISPSGYRVGGKKKMEHGFRHTHYWRALARWEWK